MYIRKRLYNPELVIDTNSVLPNLQRNYLHGKNHPVYHIRWFGGTQAGEELGTAAASVKDGTTTPFQCVVVSSNVADKRTTAAGAVHSVALIGVTTQSIVAYQEWVRNGTTTTLGEAGRPRSTVEVVAMNGTTDVTSTRFFIWVDHGYACEWGTGATDATGNITIEAPANTTLITIAATYNESDGGVWHFPPDHMLKTHFVKIEPTATLAAGDGVMLSAAHTGFDQTNNTDPDLETDYYTYIHFGGGIERHEPNELGRYTTVNSKVVWTETIIANTQNIQIEIIQELD